MSQTIGVFEQLIAALDRNTEALLAKNGAAPADEKSTSTKTTKTTQTKTKPTEKAGPKHTKAEATEVIVALKDTVGVDAAKTLLADHGFKKVADITEDKFDVLFDEATAQLEAFKKPEPTPAPEDDNDI